MTSLTSSLSRLFVASLGAALLLFVGACDNRTNNMTARCTPGCSSVQMCCGSSAGNRCVDYFSDPANCGACGNVCASGQVCVSRMCQSPPSVADAGPVDARFTGTDAPVSGACSPACGADFLCCGTSCITRDGAGGTTDPSFSNCGRCGQVCNATSANRCGRFGTTTQCLCGTGPACDATRGESCVLGTSGNYECLRSDLPENCGTPPVRCSGDETCTGGRCVCGGLGTACPSGQTCTGSGATATCRDFSSDPMNCGRAGNACQAGEECSAGACVCAGAGRACMAASSGGLPIGGGAPSCGSGGLSLPCGGGGGGIPIGGSCGEVCCPGRGCIAVDNNNCGACGNACASGQECGTSLIGGGDGGLPFP